MSSHLGTILSFIASLAIVTPILKFLFLSSYRTHLRRSKYVERRDLLQTYYNETYLKKDEKNKFVLQEDTNVLMSNDKYSYQLIFQILESNSQYFYRMIDSLKFCKWYLKETKVDDSFVLTSRLSQRSLKIIYTACFSLYLFIGFLWFIGNLYFFITKGKPLNNTTFDLIVISTVFLAFAAGKAKATLRLSKVLEIKFK